MTQLTSTPCERGWHTTCIDEVCPCGCHTLTGMERAVFLDLCQRVLERHYPHGQDHDQSNHGRRYDSSGKLISKGSGGSKGSSKGGAKSGGTGGKGKGAGKAAGGSATTAPTKPPFKPLQGTVEEKAQLLLEHGKAWEDSLHGGEVFSVVHYSENGYRGMNTALRMGDTSIADTNVNIAMLQDALLRSSAPADMMVSRGYGHSQLGAFQAAIGGTFHEKGFLSTTIDTEKGFSGFLVNVAVPKGSPGAYIEKISAWPDEREWLIPHGAKLHVLDGHQDATGRWIFNTEYQGN